MYLKKIKRSLFGTALTYLKKLCLCVRFKNNWNQGCKNLNSSSRMFWLQLLPRALKGTEWKPCAVWGTDNARRDLTWNVEMDIHDTTVAFPKMFIFVFHYVFKAHRCTQVHALLEKCYADFFFCVKRRIALCKEVLWIFVDRRLVAVSVCTIT